MAAWRARACRHGGRSRTRRGEWVGWRAVGVCCVFVRVCVCVCARARVCVVCVCVRGRAHARAYANVGARGRAGRRARTNRPRKTGARGDSSLTAVWFDHYLTTI